MPLIKLEMLKMLKLWSKRLKTDTLLRRKRPRSNLMSTEVRSRTEKLLSKRTINRRSQR